MNLFTRLQRYIGSEPEWQKFLPIAVVLIGIVVVLLLVKWIGGY